MNAPVARRVAIGLGLLSCFALAAAWLALTDISHGEADVSLEWTVVQVAFAIVTAFHVAAFVAMADRSA